MMRRSLTLLARTGLGTSPYEVAVPALSAQLPEVFPLLRAEGPRAAIIHNPPVRLQVPARRALAGAAGVPAAHLGQEATGPDVERVVSQAAGRVAQGPGGPGSRALRARRRQTKQRRARAGRCGRSGRDPVPRPSGGPGVRVTGPNATNPPGPDGSETQGQGDPVGKPNSVTAVRQRSGS